MVTKTIEDKIKELAEERMKKIMFNEPYGLQKAVLDERKTMTRRYNSYYKVGDIVAIAQRYSELPKELLLGSDDILRISQSKLEKGWNNKMFVRSELMPHHIRITDVRIEHLQDISDEDCMKEGIDYVGGYSENYYLGYGVKCNNGEWLKFGNSPREAFAPLIDALSGKGTWESNPLVYVYEFELID